VERLRPVEFIERQIVADTVLLRNVPGALSETRAGGDLRQMDLVIPFVPCGFDTGVNLGIDHEDVF
jgi:hypothetical protein